MENNDELNKNVTLSFKTTTTEKVAIQQIANEKNITRSELIASILHAYKDYYDYIGKTSPEEEKLRIELSDSNKQNRKLRLAVENAENRIEIERQATRKLLQELNVMTRERFNLEEQLKQKNAELKKSDDLLKNHQEQGHSQLNSKLLNASVGSAVLTGLSLLFIPSLFRK